MTPQTESFVPLTSAPVSGERRELRVTLLSEGRQAQPFKSLNPPAANISVPTAKTCEPRISIQRSGDRITGLRIECGCGQVMDLACIYESPADVK